MGLKMSLRYEQYNSLKQTREFLRGLLKRKYSKTELKLITRNCLKHFPPLEKDGKPIWSKDEFSR